MWLWPWFELFGSKTSKQMKIVDDYLQPILEKAVVKAEEYKKTEHEGPQEAAEADDNETLLDHLARYTTGTNF